eukprot:scaffold40163_cov80-Cyclotella_meneghiniana.AAC.2
MSSSNDAPRRGKFLSQPPKDPPDKISGSNKPATPRGKVLTAPSLPTSLTGSGATEAAAAARGADPNRNSLCNLKSILNNAKDAASARRKEVAAKRDKVFNDLEKAENIVLSLLDCASDVAKSLSEMTAAKTNSTNKSFGNLSSKISANGVGYLAGVKRLHTLLAPHASLVKAYPQHVVDDPTSSEKESDKDIETTDSSLCESIVKKATSNMYAARVEKQLVLERSAILKEMIRLEELDSSENTPDDKHDKQIRENAVAGSKRKR